ncbi:MAG TPA: hypothetical protein VJ761_01735 [Ktedonobacteraceae bacterium]|nr:hypothetical protein [Ktedonobacteraceae bacterium]
MHQLPVLPDNEPLNTIQRNLIGILPGIILAVALFLVPFSAGILTWIGVCTLLYFLAPIFPSFYVSYRMGGQEDGWVAGGTTGCAGALLTTLGVGIFIGIVLAGGSLTPSTVFTWPGGGMAIGYFMVVAFLNSLGFLISLAGTAIGTRLGRR